jgi:hypothetical protein
VADSRSCAATVGFLPISVRNQYLLVARARGKLILLKVLAKLASTFLLFWLFASPAMACLLPVAQLTQEEKACCRSMAGMCDEMGKNSSHSCCVKVRTNNPSYVIAKAGSSSVQQLPVTPLLFAAVHSAVPTAAMLIFMPTEFGYPPGHSPPGLPDLIALRI